MTARSRRVREPAACCLLPAAPPSLPHARWGALPGGCRCLLPCLSSSLPTRLPRLAADDVRFVELPDEALLLVGDDGKALAPEQRAAIAQRRLLRSHHKDQVGAPCWVLGAGRCRSCLRSVASSPACPAASSRQGGLLRIRCPSFYCCCLWRWHAGGSSTSACLPARRRCAVLLQEMLGREKRKRQLELDGEQQELLQDEKLKMGRLAALQFKPVSAVRCAALGCVAP